MEPIPERARSAPRPQAVPVPPPVRTRSWETSRSGVAFAAAVLLGTALACLLALRGGRSAAPAPAPKLSAPVSVVSSDRSRGGGAPYGGSVEPTPPAAAPTAFIPLAGAPEPVQAPAAEPSPSPVPAPAQSASGTRLGGLRMRVPGALQAPFAPLQRTPAAAAAKDCNCTPASAFDGESPFGAAPASWGRDPVAGGVRMSPAQSRSAFDAVPAASPAAWQSCPP